MCVCVYVCNDREWVATFANGEEATKIFRVEEPKLRERNTS